MQTDHQLEGMLEVATPLDEWCEFCENKLSVGSTLDGVKACAECMEQVLAALAQYEREAAEAAVARRQTPRGRHTPRTSAAAKARAKRRAKRKRTGR